MQNTKVHDFWGICHSKEIFFQPMMTVGIGSGLCNRTNRAGEKIY
jgi:hypothetical protein